MIARRLLLVGGGLANLHLLRHWRRRPVPGVELVVVVPDAELLYSGAVPAFLRGVTERADLAIDLRALARGAGARLVVAEARRISGADRTVHTDADALEFDHCAIAVGGEPLGFDTPGVREHAHALHPVSRALDVHARLAGLAAEGRPVAVCIVGAGAAGIELAFALQARFRAARASGTVRLLDGAPTLLRGAPPALRALLSELLARRGIGLALGDPVRSLSSEGLALCSGAAVPADVVLWATGTAAPALAAASDLPLTPDGRLAVDDTLRCLGPWPVFATGNSAAVQGSRALPRSGAIAVGQGPVLLHNLRVAMGGGGRPRRYRPPAHSLAILDTADGRAIAWRGERYLAGRGVAWLKRRIDARWLRDIRRGCDDSPRPAS